MFPSPARTFSQCQWPCSKLFRRHKGCAGGWVFAEEDRLIGGIRVERYRRV
jgi:hypothetical protein